MLQLLYILYNYQLKLMICHTWHTSPCVEVLKVESSLYVKNRSNITFVGHDVLIYSQTECTGIAEVDFRSIFEVGSECAQTSWLFCSFKLFMNHDLTALQTWQQILSVLSGLSIDSFEVLGMILNLLCLEMFSCWAVYLKSKT